MAATFALFEHYPIVLHNRREVGHTQPGDTCECYGSLAVGHNHRAYQGQWEEIRLTRANRTIIDPCYVPAVAIDLWVTAQVDDGNKP